MTRAILAAICLCVGAFAQAQLFESTAVDPFFNVLGRTDTTEGFELVERNIRNRDAMFGEGIDGHDVYYVYAHRSSARIILRKNPDYFDHSERDYIWAAEQFAHAWAVQPRILRETVKHVDLRVHNESYSKFSLVENSAERLFSPEIITIFFPANFWIIYPVGPYSPIDDRRTPKEGFEENMTYEMCRALDYELRIQDGCNLSDSQSWRNARRQNDKYITYRAKNSVTEDFAETCAAYILTRYDKKEMIPPVVSKWMDNNIPAKVAFFEKLFNTAAVTGVMDAISIWEAGAKYGCLE